MHHQTEVKHQNKALCAVKVDLQSQFKVSNFNSPFSPCVASAAGNPPGGPGLSGPIHEEANPCAAQSIQVSFKCFDASRIQLLPSDPAYSIG